MYRNRDHMNKMDKRMSLDVFGLMYCHVCSVHLCMCGVGPLRAAVVDVDQAVVVGASVWSRDGHIWRKHKY